MPFLHQHQHGVAGARQGMDARRVHISRNMLRGAEQTKQIATQIYNGVLHTQTVPM